ncbi:MAG: PA14 domain-containing protein [Akkermansiaceae bacterium]|nr:PA14 domain-containing protein [Akkermansiaceae bacterium]
MIKILVTLSLLSITQARATWYGENIEEGADIMMMDLRWPWWAESTYSANWNIGTLPTGVTAYGGFAGSVATVGDDHRPNLDPEVQDSFRPGSVWSFWGSNPKGEPVRVEAASEHTFAYQYIGEGASGALFGTWPVIKRNRWYTMLMRIWQPIGEEQADISYMGRWVKDVESGYWHLYGIMRLPIAAKAFTGNAGFLEDFGNECRSARAIHRRLGYYRKDHEWRKSDTVTIDVQKGLTLKNYWVVNKIDHDRTLAMELSSNRSMVPQLLEGQPLAEGNQYSFTVKQPDLPTLDLPKVEELKAETNGEQVHVSWSIPKTASPQYQIKIEIFNNSKCFGKPVAIHEERMPVTRHALIDVKVKNPTVRFSMTDIFDHSIEPLVIKAASATPPTQSISLPTAPGLKYELWHKEEDRHVNVIYPPSEKAEQSRNERHYWLSLDEIESGRLIQQGICNGFDLDLRGKRREGYAFRFRGLLRAPESGFYLIRMKGTDGYRIRIDQKETLLWDGLHGPEDKVTGLHLAKGDHHLAIDYFVDRNKPFFQLEWQGPGIPRQEIPSALLLHEAGDALPEVKVVVRADDDGGIKATVKAEPNGRKIERILFYFDEMQISSSKGTTLIYDGVLPGGNHHVWARLFYDGNHTIDTDPVPISVAIKKPSGWNLGIAGESDSTYNLLQHSDRSFSFVGEGEYVVHRPVTGDFILTCKIDQMAGLQGEPVNGDSWVGLTVREHPEKNNYGWGREFGIMQVAQNGLRTSPDHGDGAGTRQSYQRLPDGHRWLRITREKNVWTAWSSADGATWSFGARHFKKLPATVGAGIVFRALPQDAQMYFRALVSNLTLESGTSLNSTAKPLAATGTSSSQLTGLAVAPSNPNIIVVRTSHEGLLRSTDGGKTWAPANGHLQGASNAVRSVAIHPTNPLIMLRASGQADSKGNFKGGLYRTNDGGKTWKRLLLKGNFDALGPSALCGEILVFLPMDPSIIFVGCETQGLFRSDDGGDTWASLGQKGHRITAIHANPYFQNQFGQTVIETVTCPDHFMSLLGRGDPVFTTQSNEASIHVSHDNGKTFQEASSRSDLGYYNILSLRCSPHHWLYGTSHGLLYTFSQGRDSYLYSTSLEVDSLRPFTALAGSIAGTQLCSRKFVSAINPAKPGHLSRCDLGGDVWAWTISQQDEASATIAIAAADSTESSSGESWWILESNGLFRTDDSGITKHEILKP